MDGFRFEALLETLRQSMAASVTVAVAAFFLTFVVLLWMWRKTAIEAEERRR